MQLFTMFINAFFGALTTIGLLIMVWGGVTVGLSLAGNHGQGSGVDITPAAVTAVGGLIIFVIGLAAPSAIDVSWAV